MGQMKEFSPSLQVFLKAYPWRQIDPIPWSDLKKPLAKCRLALVSSAGFISPGQAPFDESVKGGDVSFRPIPNALPVDKLIDTHPSESFDHAGIRTDPNLAFPLDRVRELVESGRLGSLATLHYSFMGRITAPGRLKRDAAPAVARRLVADGVDVALLVPV